MIPTSIFCPRMEGLKFDLRTTFTSIRVLPTSRTSGITRKGKLMSLVVRYLSSEMYEKYGFNYWKSGTLCNVLEGPFLFNRGPRYLNFFLYNVLRYFTLSNARQFYLSKENLQQGKG